MKLDWYGTITVVHHALYKQKLQLKFRKDWK